MPAINYIPKEFGLDNNTLKPGEEILYSSWTITLLPSGEIVRYVERDDINKTSKLFTDVFILGNTYSVKMSLVTTNGPTIDTEPFIITITDNKDIIDLYPIPAVVDTPIVSMPYDINNIPNTNIVFNVSDIIVTGNAVLESVNWILVDDNNKIVFRSLKDEVNLKSITIKDMILDSNTAYTMYCVVKANNRDSSGAGGITFRCVSLPELDIQGDLRDSFYTLPIETTLKNNLPNLVKFDFELYGEDQVLLYTGTNNNGKITIPAYKMDNSHMLDKDDAFDYYTLKIRATTSSNIYGWREYVFNPKEWIVDSAVFDDYNFNYKDKITLAKVTIDRFNYSLANNGLAGSISQLPDGLFMIMYEFKKWGLFNYLENENRFMLVKTLEMSFMYPATPTEGTASFASNILPNGMIIIASSNNASTDFLFQYNTITKEILYKKDIIITQYRSAMERYLDNDTMVYHNIGLKSLGLLDLETNLLTYINTNMPTSINPNDTRVVKLADRVYRCIGNAKNSSTEEDNVYFDITISEDNSTVTYGEVKTYTRNIIAVNKTDRRFTLSELRNGDVAAVKLTVLNNTIDFARYDRVTMALKKYSLLTINSTKPYNFVVYFNNGKRMWLSSGDGLSDTVVYE